jgi:conjugative transfer region protein TrbK
MDWRVAAKVVAVLAFATVMAACAIALRPNGPEGSPEQTVKSRGGEPNAGELLRCREIGAAALDDAGCKKAWADSRHHFLEGNAERAKP